MPAPDPLLSGYVRDIMNAAVYEAAEETPLQRMPRLSRAFGRPAWVKREDLQPVFSFKLRGAYNRIARLAEAERARGVVCSSAGNHAQGVAFSAKRRGIRAAIVMPRTTPDIKVNAVRQLLRDPDEDENANHFRGGDVVLHGDSFADASLHARELERRDGLVFIHPYDDRDVIAGQGTVGLEILRQHQGPLDTVFVPVGGGGLMAGVAAAVKHLRPDVRVVAVEPEDAACLEAALAAGKPVTLEKTGIFTDGAAVSRIGDEPFRLATHTMPHPDRPDERVRLVDEVVTVSTDEICAAIQDLFEDTRSLAEPAGALAVAGMRKLAARNCSAGVPAGDGAWIAIESGANVAFGRLRYIADRSELGRCEEILLAITIPEVPGSLKTLCSVLGTHIITEFNYRYDDACRAVIYLGLRIPPAPEAGARIVEWLRAKGYPVEEMGGNDLAKNHVCHMIGGRGGWAAGVSERIYAFEFPERAGALPDFLARMEDTWNISAFHYRNQGGTYGNVCVALQAPPEDKPRLEAFIQTLGYPCRDETDNPAYALFLWGSACVPPPSGGTRA